MFGNYVEQRNALVARFTNIQVKYRSYAKHKANVITKMRSIYPRGKAWKRLLDIEYEPYRQHKDGKHVAGTGLHRNVIVGDKIIREA